MSQPIVECRNGLTACRLVMQTAPPESVKVQTISFSPREPDEVFSFSCRLVCDSDDLDGLMIDYDFFLMITVDHHASYATLAIHCSDAHARMMSTRFITRHGGDVIPTNSFVVPFDEQGVAQASAMHLIRHSQLERRLLVDKHVCRNQAPGDTLDKLIQRSEKLFERVSVDRSEAFLKLEIIAQDRVTGRCFLSFAPPIVTCAIKLVEPKSTTPKQGEFPPFAPLHILSCNRIYGSADGGDELVLEISDRTERNDLYVVFVHETGDHTDWCETVKPTSQDGGVLRLRTPPFRSHRARSRILISVISTKTGEQHSNPITFFYCQANDDFEFICGKKRPLGEDEQQTVRHATSNPSSSNQGFKKRLLARAQRDEESETGDIERLFAFAKNRSVVHLLRGSWRHLLKHADQDGNTPLHVAILHNNFDLVIQFVEAVKPCRDLLNMRNNSQLTPLLVAALLGESELCDFLLTAGADLTPTDPNGCNVFHVACRNQNTPLLRTILKYVKEKEVVEALDNEGFAPIHLAAMGGMCETIGALMRLGVDVNLPDKRGDTALHHAARNPQFSGVFRVLGISESLVVDAKSIAGLTPLHEAVLARCYINVILLLALGADASIKCRVPMDFDWEKFGAKTLKYTNLQTCVDRVFATEKINSSNDEKAQATTKMFARIKIAMSHNKPSWWQQKCTDVYQMAEHDVWMCQILGFKRTRSVLNTLGLCVSKDFLDKVYCLTQALYIMSQDC